MSTLARWHKEDMGVSHKHLPQGTAKHHSCWHRYQEQTLNPRQHRWQSVIICSHQVPMILLGPSRWTVIPGRHHQHRATWLDEADNAWCFMIVKISLFSVAIIYFIFSAVHVSGPLNAIFVLVILWIVWKAEVVRSTTRVTVMLSTHYTWYKAKKNINNNYSLKFCQLAKLKELCHEIQNHGSNSNYYVRYLRLPL